MWSGTWSIYYRCNQCCECFLLSYRHVFLQTTAISFTNDNITSSVMLPLFSERWPLNDFCNSKWFVFVDQCNWGELKVRVRMSLYQKAGWSKATLGCFDNSKSSETLFTHPPLHPAPPSPGSLLSRTKTSIKSVFCWKKENFGSWRQNNFTVHHADMGYLVV